MNSSTDLRAPAERLAAHLVRYPADLLDVRRLQRRFGVDAPVTLRVLAEIAEQSGAGTVAERD